MDTQLTMCVPWNAYRIQVFVHWSSWAKNVTNGSKSEPLLRYCTFQQGAPVNVERWTPLFFVYTSQLAASFVTKKRHCELSILARGRDRPNFPSLWSVPCTEMRTLWMKTLRKECLYSRHYQCMQAIRPWLSSCFWIMEQLSLWRILLCDEAQFNPYPANVENRVSS